MVEVWLPYGKTEVVVRVPNENFLGIIDGKITKGIDNPVEEIIRSIDKPVSGKKLDEIVKPGEKIAIVVDDKTRATPSHLIVPCLINKLNQLGIEDDSVSVIIGCGMHSMRLEEVQSLLDEDCLRRVKVVIHNCNAKDHAYVGKTSFGTEVYVNKIFNDADVRILTGDVNLHYFAGYGGGRKSLLPAICGGKTIQQNHKFLLHPKARTGNLEGNPVHLDMVEAAHLVEIDFVVNVVLNPHKEVIKSFAGDLDQTFLEGVKLIDEIYKVPVEERANIAIVSPGGYPMDINLYQAYKGIASVLNIVKNRGVIILVAECSQGHGNEVFYDWMVKFKTLKKIEREVRRRFVFGGHKAYYFLKALERIKIILVSVMPDYYTSSVFRLRAAKTVNAALSSALRMVGRKSKIVVVPHGTSILPTLKKMRVLQKNERKL